MTNRGNLTIGAFLDGRPGHEKQTQGVISQLKRTIPVDVVTISVERKGFVGQVADLLKYYIGLQRPNDSSLKNYDILIGTGTPTHLPMLFHKKAYGIPVITCMTPATFLRKYFDLIFSPYHDDTPAEGNIYKTVGPPNLNYNREQHAAAKTLILIGGIDPRSHTWDTTQIVKDVGQLVGFDSNKNYILSSSPRTPAETVERLNALADELENVSFFDFHDTPSGWMEKQYAACAEVWVTGDSISMVYEALSSGCRVGIIPVQWRHQKSKFVRSENYLLKQELVVHLGSYLSGKTTWANNNEINEAQRCAEEIIRRFV